MVRKKKITPSDIATMKEKLKSAPPLPLDEHPVTKWTVVRELRGEIEELRKKGYSFNNISELLTQGGVHITENTLQTYFNQSKKEDKKK